MKNTFYCFTDPSAELSATRNGPQYVAVRDYVILLCISSQLFTLDHIITIKILTTT